MSTRKRSESTLQTVWRNEIPEYVSCMSWVEIDRHKRLVVGSAGGDIAVIDQNTGGTIKLVTSAHKDSVISIVACGALKFFVSASQDGSLKLWKTERLLEEVHEVKMGSFAWIPGVAWSDEDHSIVIAVNKSVQKYFIEEEKMLKSPKEFSDHPSTIAAMNIGPKGKITTASYGVVNSIGKRMDREISFKFKGSFVDAKLSGSLQYIAAIMQEPIVAVYSILFNMLVPMRLYYKPSFIEWYPGGHILVVGNGRYLTVIDCVEKLIAIGTSEDSEEDEEDGLDIRQIILSDVVTSLKFNHSQRNTIASGSKDGTVQITHLTSDARTEINLGSEISSLLWLDEGMSLIAGTSTGDIVRLNLQ